MANGKPLFLAENLLDDVDAFANHTLSANEEAVGSEVWRIANGIREPAPSLWTPTTANSDAWFKVDCGSARAASMLFIDRGSNLTGETVTLAGSSDDSAWTTVFSATIPTSVTADSEHDTTNGVLTDEGAWFKAFTEASWRYWRLTVSAMGAGLKPTVYGAMLGKWWDPEEYHPRRFSPQERDISFVEVRAPSGWRSTGQVANPRAGEIVVRLPGFTDLSDAETYFTDHLGHGRPVLYVPDRDRAERAFVIAVQAGRLGWAEEDGGWAYPQARISYVEHLPEVG